VQRDAVAVRIEEGRLAPEAVVKRALGELLVEAARALDGT